MRMSLQNFKVALLGLAIGLGFVISSQSARADTQVALVAGGCFWCVEKDFESVPGVIEAVSGFAGGSVANPSYKKVVRGGTGHLEVVQITFDDDVLSYDQLLHMFLRSIDPLDDGGQFCDRGESYSSAIFALDASQRLSAEKALSEAAKDLGRQPLTPIRDAAPFYPAEAYHQDFYKSPDLILTRFGPQSKAKAYEKYRESCGRDARVMRLWGDMTAFPHS